MFYKSGTDIENTSIGGRINKIHMMEYYSVTKRNEAPSNEKTQ